jgi:DNA-binding XRE family transcriptional regulator
MTNSKTSNYTDWLADNPLYKWRNGKTMESVAQACGVSRQSILFWEYGRNLPKHQYMVKLAQLMDLSISDLYTVWQAWLQTKPAESPQSVQVA